MKRKALWSIVPFLLIAAPAAAVDVESPTPVSTISSEEIRSSGMSDVTALLNQLPRSEAGVNVFYQDVHAVTPGGSGVPIFGFGGAVVGAGAHYQYRPNVNSGFYLRGMGGFGVGSQTAEWDVGSISVIDKVSFSSVYGSAAGGVIMPIRRTTGAYAQAGLFYSTTKATFDDGTDEEDGEPFKVIGIDTAIGLRQGIGGKNSLFFEQYSQYGWGSAKQDGSEYKESVKYGCFRGGIHFGF